MEEKFFPHFGAEILYRAVEGGRTAHAQTQHGGVETANTIEMDDEEMGKFVDRTVTRLVYN